ncbi:response regulator [Ideonella sp.]|uniref:response regulator n=1 Tax=Ideonella sp. TaxID=1929293 RepID=UPI003BB48B95
MSGSAELPRVLLIDDDPSIRRLIVMALEDLPLTLISCENTLEAREVLARRTVDLIITDLMMPGETGASLLESFVAQPALQGAARLVVFSAMAARQQADNWPDLWAWLPKPSSIDALRGCVQGALNLSPNAAGAPSAAAPLDRRAEQQKAIAERFGGDLALYNAFRLSCIRQFETDLARGEQASLAGDGQTLAQLAHNLKSVLALLGLPEGSAAAARLENAASSSLSEQSAAWRSLRATVESAMRED